MIVGINGFGRIGKHVYRILLRNGIKVALINDPSLDLNKLYHQAKYDSTYGIFTNLELKSNSISACGIETELSVELDPENIKWAKHSVDYVVECSGVFKTLEDCSRHAVSRVLLACPSEDIPMFVYGVNHTTIKDQKVISAASCTTNCLAPLAKLMNDNFEVVEGFVTTVHSLTGTQNTVDGKGKNIRISRSCMNIIPTTTGAAFATELVIPAIKGKILATGYRVPISSVSLIDFVVKVKTPTTLDAIKKIIEKTNDLSTKNSLGVCNEEIVSSDIIGDPRSSVLDYKASQQLSPTFFKLVSWYDNEYAYSCRLIDILFYLDDRNTIGMK